MEEDRRPPASGSETPDHRGRGRRRESGSGKQEQTTNTGGLAGALSDVGLSDEQIATLESAVSQKLAEHQAKADDAVERLMRTQADFANYKRRNEQEREQQARFATLNLVSEMLDVLDNLDRAMATVPEIVSSQPWMDGLILVDRQLRAVLEKNGLQPIVAVGTRFDPMLHEAIIHEETSEHPDDEVTGELRRGYMLHDRVVRPTLVKVAKHVEPAAKQTGES